MDIEKILEDFSEYCHKNYVGCSIENDKDIYSYNTEVVCMIEGFLKEYKKSNILENIDSIYTLGDINNEQSAHIIENLADPIVEFFAPNDTEPMLTIKPGQFIIQGEIITDTLQIYERFNEWIIKAQGEQKKD